MDNRRRFSRCDTQFKAQYFFKEKKGGWAECTVIDVSRKGLGVKFQNCEKSDEGLTIHLEIYVPTEVEPVSVKGVLKRVKQEDGDFIGNIELTEVLDEDKWARLC